MSLFLSTVRPESWDKGSLWEVVGQVKRATCCVWFRGLAYQTCTENTQISTATQWALQGEYLYLCAICTTISRHPYQKLTLFPWAKNLTLKA